MATKTATKPLDVAAQQIVNQVRALVEYHVERQRDAGHTPAEITEARAALVAGIVETLHRSPQP
jgi:hypothetical protein